MQNLNHLMLRGSLSSISFVGMEYCGPGESGPQGLAKRYRGPGKVGPHGLEREWV